MREVDRLRRRLGLSAGEFADEAARTVRDTVVRNAQPFGGTRAALEKGKAAVRRDLLRCFRVVAPSSNGGRRRRGLITSSAAARSWHRQRRNSRGRVSKGAQKEITPQAFRAYLDEVQARVGMAKGSLVGGEAKELGGGRIPSFVRRWRGKGTARRRRQLFGASWLFAADPPHVASPNVMGRRGVTRVLRNQERNLQRSLERKMRRKLQRASARING
jgi:hypothetical protein